ncbi:MAG: hypothetical protein N3F66_12525 [Spirochaetes bacterium]|nr:hypothetical protein [Spirochaetota bacterium]
MHTITITIKNKKLLPKLYSLLKQFGKNEVVVTVTNDEEDKPKKKKEKKYTEDFIKKNWRKFAYAASGDITKSDDEVLADAYMEYLRDTSAF